MHPHLSLSHLLFHDLCRSKVNINFASCLDALSVAHLSPDFASQQSNKNTCDEKAKTEALDPSGLQLHRNS